MKYIESEKDEPTQSYRFSQRHNYNNLNGLLTTKVDRPKGLTAPRGFLYNRREKDKHEQKHNIRIYFPINVH